MNTLSSLFFSSLFSELVVICISLLRIRLAKTNILFFSSPLQCEASFFASSPAEEEQDNREKETGKTEIRPDRPTEDL